MRFDALCEMFSNETLEHPLKSSLPLNTQSAPGSVNLVVTLLHTVWLVQEFHQAYTFSLLPCFFFFS